MTEQLTRQALAGMSPEAIEAARVEGRLDVLLGASTDEAELKARAATETITRDDLARLAALGEHDLIISAHTENRIQNEETR